MTSLFLAPHRFLSFSNLFASAPVDMTQVITWGEFTHLPPVYIQMWPLKISCPSVMGPLLDHDGSLLGPGRVRDWNEIPRDDIVTMGRIVTRLSAVCGKKLQWFIYPPGGAWWRLKKCFTFLGGAAWEMTGGRVMTHSRRPLAGLEPWTSAGCLHMGRMLYQLRYLLHL